MIKKLTLITILLLGNIAFSQEPKLIEKYFYGTKQDYINNKKIKNFENKNGGYTNE